MSWSSPTCPLCRCSSTTFEGPTRLAGAPDEPGPATEIALLWACTRCRANLVELCPPGVDEPRPGSCLDCGAPLDHVDRCRECGVDRAEIVARVHAHCGSPPQLAAIPKLVERGLVRVALNAVDLALEQVPDDGAAVLAKATVMVEVEQHARAVGLFRRALELGVTEPGVEISLGVALANSGQPEAALKVYEAALEHERDPAVRAIVSSNCGGCLSALGHLIEAEACHRRAIEADPEQLGPRWNLFAFFVKVGRHADALAVIDQTIVLPVLDASERENLEAYRSEMLIAEGRYLDALVAIDRSLVGDPNELERLTTRARILIHLGRVEAARRVLGKVLSFDPDHPIARLVLARLARRSPPKTP